MPVAKQAMKPLASKRSPRSHLLEFRAQPWAEEILDGPAGFIRQWEVLKERKDNQFPDLVVASGESDLQLVKYRLNPARVTAAYKLGDDVSGQASKEEMRLS